MFLKRVLFRVDASAKVGLGHLMRCLALAQCMVGQGIDVTFAIRQSSYPFCKDRKDWVGSIYVLPNSQPLYESELLVRYVNEHKFDWVVLDGYGFSSIFRKALSLGNAKLAVFDDENNSGSLYADLVINAAGQVVETAYSKTAPSAILCLGERYRLLRSEFSQVRPIPWEQRHFLTLVFGGSDPTNMTIPLLLALEKSFTDKTLLSYSAIKVLTGPAYPQLDALEQVLVGLTIDVEHHHDASNLSSIFNQSRLVVSAAGGTQYELLACHTPAVLAIIADNQKPATLYAQQQGWCCVVENESNAVGKLCDLTKSLCCDPDALYAMHRKAALYADSKGAERIVQKMGL